MNQKYAKSIGYAGCVYDIIRVVYDFLMLMDSLCAISLRQDLGVETKVLQ